MSLRPHAILLAIVLMPACAPAKNVTSAAPDSGPAEAQGSAPATADASMAVLDRTSPEQSGYPEESPEASAMESPEAMPAAPSGTESPGPSSNGASAESVSFESDIQPILQSRCSPCHFEGGVMYARLPFDSPATIRQLGERLFTRIKKEEEQTRIRAFLAQDCGTAPAASSEEDPP